MHVEFLIEPIHAPGVKENKNDEDVDRPLLGEPETQLETADANLVELLDQQYTESIRTDEPDREASGDEPEISPPIGQAIF